MATGRNVYWLSGKWLEVLLAEGQLPVTFAGCKAIGRNVYWL